MGDRPKVFLSYSHDPPEHKREVLRFAKALRRKGVDCMIDQDEQVYAGGLQRWMRDRIREADFVLVVCTETYYRCVTDLEPQGVGRGVIFEHGLILQELYEAGSHNEKVIPIHFGARRDDFIPMEYRHFPSFRGDTNEGLKKLIRRLTLPPAPVSAAPMPTGATAAAASRRRALVWSTATAALLLIAAAAGFYWHERPQPANRLDRTLPIFLLSAVDSERGPMPKKPAVAKNYREGARLLAEFKPASAQQQFRDVIADEPGFPPAHAALAEIHLRNHEYYDAAEEAKLAYNGRAVLPPEVRQEIEARYWRMLGNWPRAIDAYKKLPRNLESGLGLAEVETAAGKVEDALKTIEALRSRHPKDPLIDLAQAMAATHQGNYQQQSEAADHAAEKAQRLQLPSLVARARLLQAIALYHLGDPNTALAQAEIARSAATAAADSILLMEVLNSIAGLDLQLGKLSDARDKYQEIHDRYKVLGDLQGQVVQLNNLGIVMAYLGDLPAARASLEEAAQLAAENGYPVDDARAQCNLALVLEMQGMLGEAWRRLEQTLHRVKDWDNQSIAGDALFRLAELKAARGDFGGAIAAHGSVLQRREREGGGAAESQLALARVLLERGWPEQAQAFAEQAEKKFERLPQREAEAKALLVLISLKLKRKKPADIRQAFAVAKDLAKETEEAELRIKLALVEAQVLAAEGKAAQGIPLLEPVLSETTKNGLVAIGFEVRLELGQLELTHGDRPRGRRLLTELAKKAGAAGFQRVAGEATKALTAGGA